MNNKSEIEVNKLFRENIKLAYRACHDVYKKNKYEYVELEDLIQEGLIGLYKAAQRYVDCGTSFQTYAYKVVWGHAMQYVRDKKRYRKGMRLPFGVEIDGMDILKYNISIEENEDFINVSDSFSTEDTFDEEVRKSLLRKLVNGLDTLEQDIIKLRYYGEENKTVEEVSRILEKNNKLVKRLESRALRKLRYMIESGNIIESNRCEV